MPVYDNWEALTSAADEQCKKILKTYVLPVVKEIVKRHIQSDIYSVYAPKANAWVNGGTYIRRYSLLNDANIYHEFQDDGTTLMVTSSAAPSPSIKKGYSFHNRRPGAFLQLFESGNFGFLNYTSAYHFPRPAITNAQKEIDSGRGVNAAVNKGIKQYFGS